MKKLLSAPTAINLELTEICNVKCRHCYNFWRDESIGTVSITEEKFDLIIDRLLDAGVFHVILTGGEPFAKFNLLEYGLRKLNEANISYSCNSNLMLATDEKCKRLADVGLDHILTSLPSCDPETNDYIMQQKGAFVRIIKGMDAAIRNGIRVSVNMVINRNNMHQVYESGKLIAEMGCQKLFVTRSVPPLYSHGTSKNTDYSLTLEETRNVLDEAIRVRDDFGVMIGTLVSYPLCALEDLEKYKDFVGRGCPAQSGHLLSFNANGNAHACVHEEETYGNIFDQPLQEIFTSSRLRNWHDGSYHYEGCNGCPYINICESGCSMTANATEGEHKLKDPLFVGPHNFSKHYKVISDDKIIDEIRNGLRFTAPKRLRFRQENGFHLINMRWANTMPIDSEIAEFLISYQKSGISFGIEEFGMNRIKLLANLFFKDAVETTNFEFEDLRNMAGLSINLDALPSFLTEDTI